MTIYFVLLALSESLLAQNQSYNSLICVLAFANSIPNFECYIYNVVSSAKDSTLPAHEFPISLTYIKYNNGPNIEP